MERKHNSLYSYVLNTVSGSCFAVLFLLTLMFRMIVTVCIVVYRGPTSRRNRRRYSAVGSSQSWRHGSSQGLFSATIMSFAKNFLTPIRKSITSELRIFVLHRDYK